MYVNRTGICVAEKMLPMLRRVCSRSFDIPIFNQIFVLMDEAGPDFHVINERNHESVIDLFGRPA
jgi:hypothetical protein